MMYGYCKELEEQYYTSNLGILETFHALQTAMLLTNV